MKNCYQNEGACTIAYFPKTSLCGMLHFMGNALIFTQIYCL